MNRTNSMVGVSLLVIFLLSFFPGRVIADEVLIKELESLRKTLSFKDPSRIALSLRLADLYFDESIKKGPSEQKLFRQRAARLYNEALGGADGRFIAAKGLQKVKIQFQLARLYSEINRKADSKKFFSLVLENSISPLKLKRESALRLAEIHEDEGGRSVPKARSYYEKSISLCRGGDVCSYAYYRLAWLIYRAGDVPGAIPVMEKALYDSKGQIREESLRDYILFLSNLKTDGEAEIQKMEALAEKIIRPDLLQQLSDAFFAAGNRVAGTKVLAHYNEKKPVLANQVRLLEEFYGFRNWESFRGMLDDLSLVSKKDLPSEKKKKALVEKILRRLVVQLDAGRKKENKLVPELQASIMLYLRMFPTAKIRAKMIDGWLAAEASDQKKLDQLKIWIDEEQAFKNTKEEIRFRDARTGLAQKLKDYPVVVEESRVLAEKVSKAGEKRQYSYVYGRALYELKKYDEAVPVFEKLAKSESVRDKWMSQSRHLLLDIFNQKKNYAGIVKNARDWSQQKGKESGEFKKIANQAEFEWATAQGETPEALEIFKKYCSSGAFKEKACPNARVLAVKLANQPALIEVLKIQKDEAALADEYEAAGFFGKAAQLQEKQKLKGKTKKLTDFLKIALLFELADDFQSRDRVLVNSIRHVRKTKKLDEETQLLYYSTLREAKLLKNKHLSLPWSKAFRLRLANDLELEGNGSKQTRKLLLASMDYAGPAWSKLVLKEIEKLDRKQRKIGFYGRRSKRRFQIRLRAVKRLEKESEKFLHGADSKTRVAILKTLENAYSNLAQKILDTPLPKELNEEAKLGLQAAIQKMVVPFSDQSKKYAKLGAEQLLKIGTPAEQAELAQAVSQEGARYSDTIRWSVAAPSTPVQPKFELSTVMVEEELRSLHKNPNNRAALVKIKDFYESRGKSRLASYFKGRIIHLDQNGVQR